jgi:hypothetical protein
MTRNSNDFYSRLSVVSKAWSTRRPNKKFGDFTHEDFLKAVEPSRVARVQVAELEKRLAEAIASRDEADSVSRRVLQRVVNAVRADGEDGEDSELYSAMGYVPRTVRNSLRGIRRAMNAEKTTEETT